MNCWHCDRPAHGACRFCGRGICREHTQTMPFVLAAFAAKESIQVIVVADALYCGICKPQEEPVTLESERNLT